MAQQVVPTDALAVNGTGRRAGYIAGYSVVTAEAPPGLPGAFNGRVLEQDDA